jgi:arginase
MNENVALRTCVLAAARSHGGLVAPIRKVIAVQGWSGDRTAGAMNGSGFLAARIASMFGIGLERIGTPGPVADLAWNDALDRAAPTLAAAQAAIAEESSARRATFTILNRCVVSLATVPRLLARHPTAVLVWLDAHGDYNTPRTTATGYLGGMVVSALCGLWRSGFGDGLTPDRVLLVGARDLDPPEAELLERDGVAIVRGQLLDLDIERIAYFVAGRPVIIHIDLDVHDPVFFPTEYFVPGGLHPAAVRRLVRRLARSASIIGIEIAEFDLVDDPDHAACSSALAAAIVAPVLPSTND